MANNLVKSQNGAVTAPKRTPFSVFMQNTGNKLVANTLTDPKRNQQFVANLVSAVSSNPVLAECDQISIVSAALQAEALHFPINNALGYVYLVPFSKKEYNPQTHQREEVAKIAQFQIGYKGYIQLAIRSGQYKNIDAIEVKEGEIGRFNPIDGQEYNWIQNPEERLKAKTIGYLAFLTLTNGFHKEIYMTKEAMENHADTYSQAFNLTDYHKFINGEISQKDMWKFSSYWYKDFSEMAKKTVIRQLLSKWGIMSVEMQEAYIKDQAEMQADGTYNYVDANTINTMQNEETGEIIPDVPQEENTPNQTVLSLSH